MATEPVGAVKENRKDETIFVVPPIRSTESEMFPRGRWWTPLNIDATRFRMRGEKMWRHWVRVFRFLCANELQAELDYSIARFVALGQQKGWGGRERD